MVLELLAVGARASLAQVLDVVVPVDVAEGAALGVDVVGKVRLEGVGQASAYS